MTFDVNKSKPCPHCRALIPRHNFHAVVFKCKRCLAYVCPNCTVGQLCHDCYVTEYADVESNFYFKDNQSRVARHAV
jgi:hypothetical protein